MKKVGRYDILEELGRGATGVVYKAFDPTIGRVVALKVLSLAPASVNGLPGAKEIFMREARAAGSLSHPGIVTIHDALEDPQTQACCIVMEFVAGRTLDQVFALVPKFETGQFFDIARQVADSLDYAHRQNVIHRDLKPANIILTEDGQAKLTDFGIAKVMAREGALRTASFMGTPSYMSPEQVTGGEVDTRSDLFSLGIILYRMLTGEKPFKGDTAAVMFKIAYEDPVPPSQLNPALGPGEDYLVLRCLAKNRNNRYSTAREFLDDLEDVGQGRAPRSEAQVPLSELRVGEPTLMMLKTPEVGPQLAATKKKTTMWISAGAGGGLLILASLTGFWISHHRRIAGRPPAAASAITASPGLSPPSLAPAPRAPLGELSSTESKTRLTPDPAQVAKEAELKPRPRSRAQPGSAPHASVSSRTSAGKGTAPSKSPVNEAGQVVQLVCRHDLANATLVVSSSSQIISRWPLKGRRKGGIFGIKGGHSGTLSRSLTIPVEVRELFVRVVSRDGSFDLSRRISAAPPAGVHPSLQVEVKGDQLTVSWKAPPRPRT